MSAIAERRRNNERRIARMNVWIDLAENTPGGGSFPSGPQGVAVAGKGMTRRAT